MSSCPSVDEFAEVLQEEERWYQLGVFLGASTKELNAISDLKNHSTCDILMLLIQLYDCLEKKEKSLSWESIATALRRIGNHALAEKIHSQYVKPSIKQEHDTTDQTPHPPSIARPPTISNMTTSTTDNVAWENIIKALEKMGNHRLAEKITSRMKTKTATPQTTATALYCTPLSMQVTPLADNRHISYTKWKTLFANLQYLFLWIIIKGSVLSLAGILLILWSACIAPNVIVVNDESMAIHRTNSTHGSITSTVKVHVYNIGIYVMTSRDGYIAPYPKSVTTNMSCTSSLIPEGRPAGGQTIISVLEQQVTVRHDGSIVVDTAVPVDHRCAVGLTFNNGELSTSTDPFDIITNQLQSCSYSILMNGILCSCQFSNFSGLCGCRVIAISKTTFQFIDITSSQGHGVIEGVPDGEYLMKCYGLKDCGQPDSDVSDSVISYNSYDRDILVLSGGESISSSTSMSTEQFVVEILTTIVFFPFVLGQF